ncbi:hypothetical protein Glove_642g9 [Diversispora epigaea]|uniref:VWFA domain-containing protein n=1 Tax=Diversispora epigaea TaxID=1348612 RepID=A0A397G4G1_9GLOM|nr:hypothetical protein Glove_642g9 [Diversispora epigaea]
MNVNISPNPARKKDYISHSTFWERTNFEDPYSQNDRDEFKKCDHECAGEEHHRVDEYGREPTKSYCTLEIFHPSLDNNSIPPNNIGYISTCGHHFLCENPATSFGDFHIMFVVDRSGSMSASDCRPPCTRTATYGLRNSHNNRLGAVYEAVYSFIETRRNSRRSAQNRQMIVDNDTASLVLFDGSAIICAFENRSLTNPDDLLQIMMTYDIGGTTNYAAGINAASRIIQRYYNGLKTNVVLFLSDGFCKAPEYQVRDLCSKVRNRDHIYIFIRSRSLVMVRMVNIAKEYLPQNNNRQSLTCEFVHAVDEIRLIEYFTSVAESLRKHKPTLIRNY